MKKFSLLLHNDTFNLEEITVLLGISEKSEFDLLLSRADETRRTHFGSKIHLRGIIEFSNHCVQDCLYCGLRAGNRNLERYRMNKKQILKTAELIHSSGIKTIVLQSGEDNTYSGEFIGDLIRQIKNITDAAVTLSLGERKFKDYELWKESGADRYLLKHETGNPELYSIYHQKQLLSERLDHLRFLKSIGYQTGSGNLIGLPFQKTEDIARDILLCKQLGVDMASFSPFIPSPSTPYRNKKAADPFMVQKVIAVARIVLKDVYIPVTTALATIHPDGRKLGLLAGANVIMPDFTPPEFCDKYEIFPGKKYDQNISSVLSELRKTAESVGLSISSARGDSLKLESRPDPVFLL